MTAKTTTSPDAKAKATAARKTAADAKAVFTARNPKSAKATVPSWASIGAKLGVSPATARRLYDLYTDEPGSHHYSRIPGKGGRTAKAQAEATVAA